jgi:hypothetical protein
LSLVHSRRRLASHTGHLGDKTLGGDEHNYEENHRDPEVERQTSEAALRSLLLLLRPRQIRLATPADLLIIRIPSSAVWTVRHQLPHIQGEYRIIPQVAPARKTATASGIVLLHALWHEGGGDNSAGSTGARRPLQHLATPGRHRLNGHHRGWQATQRHSHERKKRRLLTRAACVL